MDFELDRQATTMLSEEESTDTSVSVMASGEASLAPVIIEELEESQTLDINMSEFVEVNPLRIDRVIDNAAMDEDAETCVLELGAKATEEYDASASTEEDILTHRFINGELTFSEYSCRLDSNLDLEGTEAENSRNAREARKTESERSEKPLAEKCATSTRPKKKRRILPPALQGLMGEANLRFARGEVDLAVQMCMEIIRQVPSASEPFQTLAMIYETDQPEKSLQFSLIAAHLSVKDADQWIRLANLSLESGDVKQAITCYSKAIQANPTDVSLYEERAKLQEKCGDGRAWLKGYTRLINHLGPEDGQRVVHYSKLLAQRCMRLGNNESALEAMDHIFVKCPERVTLEEVNVMTELLITLKKFDRCLDILTAYTSIKIVYATSDEGGRTIDRCDAMEDVVIDLRAKCLITLVGLDHFKIAEQHLSRLLDTEDPEVSGDLYLDIAEALMTKRRFETALTLLEALVKSRNYSLAAVWLRHAECWVGCRNVRKAIESYEVVRTLSPQHIGARMELAKLYKLVGNLDQAIEVLRQDRETDVLDPLVIYRRAHLLLRARRYDEFIDEGKLLLARHCVHLRSKAELTSLTKCTGVRQRRDALQLYRLSLGENLEEENSPVYAKEYGISMRDEFALFLRMCRVAFGLGKYGTLQRICFGALTSKRFEKKNLHIMYLCLIACIHAVDWFHGYNLVRDLVRALRGRSNTWNLLNVVIQRTEGTRHNRLIMRLLGREDALSYLQILHANDCLVSGTYKYAVNDYVPLFKAQPNGLLALLIAVTFLQMACQKHASKKHHLVSQAFAFLSKYVELRETEARHECNYNMARALHQLGLLTGAIHHYKLVLETLPSKLTSQHPERLDLKRAAAFNLHLIYMQSGNPELATTYLEDYIVI